LRKQVDSDSDSGEPLAQKLMSKANSEGIKPDEEHQDANTAASSKRMNQQ
jgi:hypothetical protein